MNAIERQMLIDDLLVMDGGCVTLRDGRSVVRPRVGNHTISSDRFREAVRLGYAVVSNPHNTVRVTEAGWAFAGMA